MLAGMPPPPLTRTAPHAAAKSASPRPPPKSVSLPPINAHREYYWTTEAASKADGANTGATERRGILPPRDSGPLGAQGWREELLVCAARSEATTGRGRGGSQGPLLTSSLLNADGDLAWRLGCLALGS